MSTTIKQWMESIVRQVLWYCVRWTQLYLSKIMFRLSARFGIWSIVLARRAGKDLHRDRKRDDP